MRTINEYSDKTIEAIHKMEDAVDNVRDCIAEGKSFEDVSTAIDMAKEAKEEANKNMAHDIMGQIVDEFHADPVKAFNDYLADWSFMGYGFSVDSKTGDVSNDADKTIRIRYSALDSFATRQRIASKGNWAIKMAVFAHNIARNQSIAVDDNGNPVTLDDLKELSPKLVAKRNELGDIWVRPDHSPKTSADALAAQYTDLANSIAPEGVSFFMKKCHVKKLWKHIYKHVRRADSGSGKVKLATGVEMEEIIFEQLHGYVFNVADKVDHNMGEKSDDAVYVHGEEVHDKKAIYPHMTDEVVEKLTADGKTPADLEKLERELEAQDKYLISDSERVSLEEYKKAIEKSESTSESESTKKKSTRKATSSKKKSA